MATVNILITARNQANAALTAARTQTQALGNSVASLTRRMFAQQRAVSSVAGAYRDANGLWRQANGRLLTQRHTVTQVTTAFGHMTNAARGAARQVGNMVTSARDLANKAGPAIGQMGVKLLGLLTVAVPVAGVLADLSGLIQLLAPAIVAAGAAAVTLKLGFHGVGDALKAGLEGDTKKFKEALKQLAPQAAGTVKALVEIGKSWRNVRREVQNRLFHNMGRALLDVNAVIQPLAAKWLPRIAEGFNAAAQSLGKLFRESAASGQLDTVMAGVQTALSGIVASVPSLTQVFLDFAEVASPTFGDVGTSIQSMSERFAEWVRKLKEDGTLKGWLDKAKETFGKVKEIGEETRRVIVGFFSASQQSSQQFLDSVRTNMQKLADWVNSDDGRSFIRFWGEVANAVANVIIKVQELRDLMGMALPVPQAKQYTPPGKRSNPIQPPGNTGGGAGGGGMKFRASGGISSGLTAVGERGVELVDFSRGRVYSHERSRQMARGMGGGGGRAVAVHLSVAAARGGVGDPLAEAFLSLLRRGALQLRAGGTPVLPARV